MRAVVTRVSGAEVEIGGEQYSSIGKGLLVLLGVHESDTHTQAEKIADRLCKIRIFEDESGKMNVSPDKAGAQLLIVSQFTLYADCKQRRPGFSAAARPEKAAELYECCIAKCRGLGFTVATGRFGADMKVSSVNDGPVTIILDTDVL